MFLARYCSLSNVLNLNNKRIIFFRFFFRYTSELFSILENKLIGYADDSTSIAVVPSPASGRVPVTESLNFKLGNVNE